VTVSGIGERYAQQAPGFDGHAEGFSSVTCCGNRKMTKIRRGNCVFVTWKGDHAPQPVHVYRDGRLVVKWDLIRQMPLKGAAPRRFRLLLRQLRNEGLL
jgi:hypothetical protein